MNVLELKDVTKKYGGFTAVDGVSLEIEQGKVLSLLGPSGCGKTTTLRIIAGFASPDGGIVRIAGEDVSQLKPYERNVGLLFQDYALFPHMTVTQNVAYGMRFRGSPAATVLSRVERMLSLVQLSGLEDRCPHQLSGGQQQRVALARALATDPKIVLLDEPLSALDAKLRLELRIELKEILRSVGATTIVVTHDQEEALSLGDEVVVMHAGKIVQRGTPSEIYKAPAHKFVAEFVGRSNWFHATRSGRSTVGISSFVTNDGVEIRARSPQSDHNDSADLCVRPEHIELADSAAPEPAQDAEHNVLTGVVLDVASLGSDIHVVVELPGKARLLAIRKNAGRMPGLAPGQHVRAIFSASDVLVFEVD
ncbi:ABC transporter ATP-binding protein [Bradyrhizobium sp. IC3069]|uniref:ABC transporter ATP-binding protein n=1 Tax=unclassified Bradyrhizobium TaxID=2631580 RepID=UPI001CD2C896|nr:MULTISPECIES: ABC transporter ATP-binding protein [unclassified Bradyrhizobium]MCA1363369.1 ABC transporter ATP-binding protein [Bradyrhizobium sp. IC4059]MCA1520907.1 ABC transporter ATP-binding protein [Bradyrhizobium sp. IC3069]